MTAEQKTPGPKAYEVVCAGLSYRNPGDEHATAFALSRQVITLDETEAARLIALGAVVPSDAPAVVLAPLPVVSDNPDNPYGGTPLTSAQAHADAAVASAGPEVPVTVPPVV